MVSSRLLPPLPNKPDKTNWIEEEGGLPDYFVRVGKHIYYGKNKKYTESHAIAGAIEVTKQRAAKGNSAAQEALADWARERANRAAKRAQKVKAMSVSKQYRDSAPTVNLPGNSKAYPIKMGDHVKLASAIRLYNMNKKKYSPADRAKVVAHIRSAAKGMGVKVGL